MQDRPEWTCTRWIFSHPSSPPFQCWECSPPAWQWSRSLPIQAKIHLQYINSNVYRLQSWLLKTKTVLRKPENVFFASPDSRSGLTVLMEVHCSMNTSWSMRFLPVTKSGFNYYLIEISLYCTGVGLAWLLTFQISKSKLIYVPGLIKVHCTIHSLLNNRGCSFCKSQ